jgi:hypothetical protein
MQESWSIHTQAPVFCGGEADVRGGQGSWTTNDPGRRTATGWAAQAAVVTGWAAQAAAADHAARQYASPALPSTRDGSGTEVDCNLHDRR